MPDQPSLYLSYGPHIRSARSTTQIMWMVNFALAPALVWAVLVFGWRVLAITAASVLGCALGEYWVCRLRQRKSTLADGSAFCSGLLLAYTLPPGLPTWMPLIGGFLAITLTKGVFGGLGYNLFNVALIGRAMMMASFPVAMTTRWLVPRLGLIFPLDGIATSTPLAVLKEKGFEAALATFYQHAGSWDYIVRMCIGLRPGSIGEVSVLWIAIGAMYLFWKGIIRLWIPLSVFLGVLTIVFFSHAPVLHFLGGGLWLGAFFMATDYVTSPNTIKGQVIFGLGIGILTGIIRLYGGYPEGICYSILLMNILVPALNDWFRPERVSSRVGVPS